MNLIKNNLFLGKIVCIVLKKIHLNIIQNKVLYLKIFEI